MEVHVIKSGKLLTNSYVISKGKECIVIDPSFAGAKLDSYIKEKGYQLLGVFLTHGHWDHIRDSEYLANRHNCKIYLSKKDLDLVLHPDLNGSLRFYKSPIELSKRRLSVFDREVYMKLGELMIEVIFTPGHTKGSCCYKIDNELFTGDTLLRNGIGRTDLYGGNENDIIKSIGYLFSMPPEIVLFPGHGYETTIGYEKKRYI